MKRKTFKFFQIILIGWAIVLTAGCGSTFNPDVPDESLPAAPISITSTPGVDTPMNTTETPSASGPEKLIDLVKADLAQRLSVSVDQISVIESESVEWSDSSLGCPQPDMLYMQVITPGRLIVLEVNGQQYEYHSGRDTYFVYCENPLPPAPPRN